MTIATWIGTFAGVIGAIAGVISAIYIFSEIHRRQIERLFTLQEEYDGLGALRNIFWADLKTAYNDFKKRHEIGMQDVYTLITNAGPPCCLEKAEILHWIEINKETLDEHQKIIFAFAQEIYPPSQDGVNDVLDISILNTIGIDFKQFHQARAAHSKLWEKWGSLIPIKKINKAFPSAYHEWIILSWLEIALTLWTRNKGKGKENLFNLAKLSVLINS